MTRTIASLVLLPALAVPVSSCGGSAPPAASPASSEASNASTGSTHKAHADEGSRLLTEPECQKLGQWMSDACQSRPNDRSAKVDGWCSDVMRGVSNGSWVDGCEKRVTQIDSMCLQSSSNVHIMMDCAHSVNP